MSRRKSRKLAFQTLFQVDQVGADPEKAMQWLMEQTRTSEAEAVYTRSLIRGVMEHQDTIDELLREFSKSWKLERMFGVDRVILRMGSYEILYGDVPAAIAIDEAIEITKAYGDEQSPAFVNAILDPVKKHHEQHS